jgi:hypothetical protein
LILFIHGNTNLPALCCCAVKNENVLYFDFNLLNTFKKSFYNSLPSCLVRV